MAKVGHRGGVEGALGLLEEETMCPESAKDEADVLEVCCPRCAVNEDVVEENQHKPAEECLEDVVHPRLESRRRVAQAERHDQELKVAMVGAEGGLGDVLGVHVQLMITRPKSGIVKYLAPWSSSRSSSTIGMGNLSLDVLSLRAL